MAIRRRGMRTNRPKSRRATVSEADLAADVMAWLRDLEWEVYQEVQIGVYGRRIDIVAVQGPVIWAIECKRRHNFDVVEQAMYWLGAANRVSIAVGGRLRKTVAKRRFHEMLGIGWLHVDCRVEEVVAAPTRRRNKTLDVRSYLCEGQRTEGVAGSQGEYWTSFAETKRRVVELIRRRPGLTMKQIVEDGGGYHYASSATARSSLAKWIGRGVIPGVEARREGRQVRYYPEAY